MATTIFSSMRLCKCKNKHYMSSCSSPLHPRKSWSNHLYLSKIKVGRPWFWRWCRAWALQNKLDSSSPIITNCLSPIQINHHFNFDLFFCLKAKCKKSWSSFDELITNFHFNLTPAYPTPNHKINKHSEWPTKIHNYYYFVRSTHKNLK